MLNPISVLIADDDADDRLSLRQTLEGQGYRVIEAADGVETFLQAQSELPDLIILDVGMPPDDGISVCRRIRANPTTSKIPILMLTCHGLVEERTAGLYAGADDYVIKPCDNDELFARISAMFRRYPPRSNFFDRIEHAHSSIEAAETYRRNVIVINVDVTGSSEAVKDGIQEYARKLVYRDYHTMVELAVASSQGSQVAWAGDGGTSEFNEVDSAVSAALSILNEVSQHSRLRDLVLRIGIAGGLELIEPYAEIGKRTSQTHNRAGHFQKNSNYQKVTIGKEIYRALSDKSRFHERRPIDGEIVFESI